MQFIRESGMFAIPLLALTLVIAVLIVRGVLRRDAQAPFAVLFWGLVAAVLGFLGQCSGLYIALTVISQAEEISPSAVSRGFAESFSTTLWGGGLLLISALAWFGLRFIPPHRRTHC